MEVQNNEFTMSNLPTLKRYATITNNQLVYLLQYLLYLNGYNPNGFDGAFGDLLQMGARIQQNYNEIDNYNLLPTDIMLLIGCDSDTIPLNYGFTSANDTCFDADDFYGDIDGVNIAKLMIDNANLKIYDAFRNYYTSLSESRFSNYVEMDLCQVFGHFF